MDLLDLIKEKIKVFLDTEQLQGLESVIHHIEISEKHFTKAKNSGDDYLFTDVIFFWCQVLSSIFGVASIQAGHLTLYLTVEDLNK